MAKFNFKKIAAVLLTAALSVTGLVVPASAADTKELQAAMAVAKTRLDIPDDYSEFEYYKRTAFTGDVYCMTWSSKDGSEWISVGVAGNIIIGYENYLYSDARYYSGEDTESAFGFGKLTASQIMSKAEEYLKMFNEKAVTDALVIPSDSLGISTSNECAQVNFQRMYNGIEVSGDSGEIVINKNTGDLLAFGMTWTQDAEFKDNAQAISQKSAQSSFSEKVGVKAIYRKNTESSYKDGEWTYDSHYVILYVPENDIYPIDAFTGELSAFEDSYRYRGWTTYSAAAINSIATSSTYDTAEEVVEDSGGIFAEAAGGIAWNESESTEIEKTENLLTVEEILKLFKEDEYLQMPSAYKVTDSYLYRDSNDKDKYYWRISVSNGSNSGYMICNAATGDLYTYYLWDNPTNNKTTVSDFDEEAALKTAEGLFQKYNKDKTGEYKFLESSFSSSVAQPLMESDSSIYGYSVVYSRYANGIEVENDKIKIGFNSKGKVTSYNISYDEEAEFPSAKNIISEEKALSELFKQKSMTLAYNITVESNEEVYDDEVISEETAVETEASSKATSPSSNSKASATSGNTVYTALLYSMDSFALNAETGVLCDYSGNETGTQTYDYSDTDGYKYLSMINKLKQYGIALYATADGTLSPDSLITEEDYIKLLRQAGIYASYNSNELKDYITKRDAVKYFAEAKYSKNLLTMSGIYKSLYTDVAEDNEYIGYINAAKNDNFVTSKTSAKFNPDHKLTRIEALKMIYNYFSK